MLQTPARAAAVAESGARRPHGTAADWRAAIRDAHRRPLRNWLLSVAAMTFAVMVVGGVTRLTHSGLSIVDWQPLLGVIPPLSDAQWQYTFDQYRQFPEYQLLRQGMTLGEFKFIYFWEYAHRLLARTIGLVFLLPLVWFWVRGYFTRPLLLRALLLFALGALQGLMGWVMVMSGLVDRPSVSHYRLAAHLTLAFLIFGWAVWLARDITAPGAHIPSAQRTWLQRSLLMIGTVLGLQIVWGAFVAGLRAGKIYPTFPLMGGRLVPADLLALDGVLQNFVANPSAVQWVHRGFGTLLATLVIYTFAAVRQRIADATSRRYSAVLCALVVFQFALGIMTLRLLVPVTLGVLHQAMAMIIFGVWLTWLHRVQRAVAV